MDKAEVPGSILIDKLFCLIWLNYKMEFRETSTTKTKPFLKILYNYMQKQNVFFLIFDITVQWTVHYSYYDYTKKTTSPSCSFNIV